jgi:hypothetical protein
MKILAPVVGMIALLCAATASAQDPPPACLAGNLKDNYLGQTCTVGGLTFAFERDFSGGGEVDPASIRVTPLTSPPGLRFNFPVITPPDNGKITCSFRAQVSAAGALTAARSFGNFGGKKIRSSTYISAVPVARENTFSILELFSFVNSATGRFATPGPRSVRAGFHLDVEEAGQPTLSFTMTGG